MKCLSCGATTVEGKYCSQCGTRVQARTCQACGEEPPADAFFCTQCGVSMEIGEVSTRRKAGGREQRKIVWGVVGMGLVAMILFVAWPIYGPNGRSSPERAPSPPITGASSVDLSSMTPREAADRLFNRVMAAVEQDDSTEVVQFLPMSIRAYELAEPLDLDGKFHLGVLRMQGTLTQEGLAAAEDILATYPDHLLGLGLAADALLALGDTVRAQGYYSRWLEVYSVEMASGLPEYLNHERMLPDMEARARAQTN